MQPSARTAMSFLGLALTFSLGGSAVAAPFELPPQKPQTQPQLPSNPTVFTPKGLQQAATVTPRRLHQQGVSMDIHRALKVLASKNVTQLTTKTQLWLRFEGAAGKSYSVDCDFTDNPGVHIMEWADDTLLRQARSNPVDGTVNHQVASRGNARKIKLMFQTTKDTDWSRCRVTPSS